MATTDSNGILQLEVSDPVVPLQTALNGIGASVSSAMDSTVRTFKVANATARNNLATQRTPSKSDPLRVWRQDTGVYEINDGTGWRSETPAGLDPNLIIIDGVAYERSGVLPPITITTTTGTGNLYAGYVNPTVPTPPGWDVIYQMLDGPGNVWMGPSGGNSIKGVGFISTSAGSHSVSLAWQLIKL